MTTSANSFASRRPQFGAAAVLLFVAVAMGPIASPPPVLAQLDTDNDGLTDLADPCPLEVRNLCFGPIATDLTSGSPIRLNAGGKVNVECTGRRVDCNGFVWNQDFGFNLFAKTGICDLNGGGELCDLSGISDIFGCEDEATEDIFQCEHFDRAPLPELAYSFAVANDEYLVNLYFANTFLNTVNVGDRFFDVFVEGALVYDDFDQVAAAGGSGIVIVRSAVATVTDGTLDIAFSHEHENPAVKAIEAFQQVDCLTNAECADADLCNGAETCVAVNCVGGAPVVCQPEEECDPTSGTCVATGGPCVDNGDCIGGEVCNLVTSLCQPLGGPCDDDDDCAGGEVCNLTTGICQQLGGPCEEDIDCTGGEQCNLVTEVCQLPDGPCTTNADCVSTQLCNGVNCETPPTTTTTTTTITTTSTTTTLPGLCVPLCDDVCERCRGVDDCQSICGNPFQPDTSGTTTTDALLTLRTATELETCALCLCDATGDLNITATDALAILRFAVGLPVTLNCPGPEVTTTTSGPTTTTTLGGTTTTLGGTTTTGGPTTTTTLGATTTTTGGATTTTGGPTTTTTLGATTTTAGPTTTTTLGGTTTTAGPTTTTTLGATTTTAGPTTTTTLGATTTTSGPTTTTTVPPTTTTTTGATTTTTL